MSKKNKLITSTPYSVETAIKGLGSRIRLARINRDLTIKQVAEKIGTGPRAVMDAEQGKPGTSIVVYVALLWVLDLLDKLVDVADPAQDKVGLALSQKKERARSKINREYDDDF